MLSWPCQCQRFFTAHLARSFLALTPTLCCLLCSPWLTQWSGQLVDGRMAKWVSLLMEFGLLLRHGVMGQWWHVDFFLWGCVIFYHCHWLGLWERRRFPFYFQHHLVSKAHQFWLFPNVASCSFRVDPGVMWAQDTFLSSAFFVFKVATCLCALHHAYL